MTRPRNLRKSRQRCTCCGLRTTLHFTSSNAKLDCESAMLAHPHATVLVGQTLHAALIASIEKAQRSMR